MTIFDAVDAAQAEGDPANEQGTETLPSDHAPSGVAYNDYDADGSDADNSRYHDEELTISAISGNQISFTNNEDFRLQS